MSQALVRLISATGQAKLSWRDLGLAMDVSRARHMGLAQAAVILARAEGGSDTALRRLGIILPKITSNVDTLRQRHDAAVASGAKFTAAQKQIYEQSLANAQALDKEATRTNIITELQRRFGGQTAAFAATAAGQYERLHETIKNVLEDLGRALLPGLTSAASGLQEWIASLRDSERFTSSLQATMQTFGIVFHAAGDAIRLAAPPLRLFADAAAAVARTAGAGGIVSLAVAYKSASVAIGLASSAQAVYAKTAASAIAAETGVVAARTEGASIEEAYTAALEQNTLALGLNITALRSHALAQGLDVAAMDAAIASTRASTAARAISTEVTGFGTAAGRAGTLARGLGAGLRSIISPQTALAIGVAGLAFGIYKLVTRETEWDRANKNLAEGLFGLSDAIGSVHEEEKKLADLRAEVPTLRASRDSALLAVERDKEAIANSRAAKSSIEYRTLTNQLATDQAALKSAAHQLSEALNEQAQAVQRLGRLRVEREDEAQAAIRRTLGLARSAAQTIPTPASVRLNPNEAGRQEQLERRRKLALDRYTNSLRDQADAEGKIAEKLRETNPIKAAAAAQVSRNIRLLSNFAESVGRLPTEHETKIILRLVGRENLTAVRAQLGDEGAQDTMRENRRAAAVTKAYDDTAHTVRVHATAVVHTADEAAQSIRRHMEAYGKTIHDSVTSAAQAVSDAQTSLSDTIAAGKDAVASSIVSAKQSLNTLGASLADTINSYLDKVSKKADDTAKKAVETQHKLTGAAKREYDSIRAQLAAGHATPELEQRARALQATLEQRSARDAAKKADTTTDTTDKTAERQERIKRELADLTDLYNKHAISRQQFERRLTKILRDEGVTRQKILRTQGVAAADAFTQNLKDVSAQATALRAGPQARGTGLAAQIVRPLDALRQSEKDNLEARKRLSEAENSLRQAEIDEQKQLVAELKRFRGVLAGKGFTRSAIEAGSRQATPTRRTFGGPVHGPAGTDRVPALLTTGEIVFNQSQQQNLRGMLGVRGGGPGDLFHHVARGGGRRFADGGAVGDDEQPRRLQLGGIVGAAKTVLGAPERAVRYLGRVEAHQNRYYAAQEALTKLLPRVEYTSGRVGRMATFLADRDFRTAHFGGREYRYEDPAHDRLYVRVADAKGRTVGLEASRSSVKYATGESVTRRFAEGGVAGPERIPLGRVDVPHVTSAIDHVGARDYRWRDFDRSRIPMRRDIHDWARDHTGRGVAPAAGRASADWWRDRWPAQQRFAFGGAASGGELPAGQIPAGGIPLGWVGPSGNHFFHHESPHVYTMQRSRGARVPMQPDVREWIDNTWHLAPWDPMLRGVRLRLADWWKEKWPAQQRFQAGGVARAQPFGQLATTEKQQRIIHGLQAGRLNYEQANAAWRYWHLGRGVPGFQPHAVPPQRSFSYLNALDSIIGSPFLLGIRPSEIIRLSRIARDRDDPRRYEALSALGATATPGSVLDRRVLSATPGYFGREGSQIFRVNDLWPGLAFEHKTNVGGIASDIVAGRGIRDPIEIDWDPFHGAAAIIQGNHRLIAARQTGMPYIPAFVGHTWKDLPAFLEHSREGATQPHHRYGQVKTGKLPVSELKKFAETDNPWMAGPLKPGEQIPREVWENAIGLPWVFGKPGSTVRDIAKLFHEKRAAGGVAGFEDGGVVGAAKLQAGGVAHPQSREFAALPDAEKRRRILAGFTSQRTDEPTAIKAWEFWKLGRLPTFPKPGPLGPSTPWMQEDFRERALRRRAAQATGSVREIPGFLDDLAGFALGIKPSEIIEIGRRAKRGDPEALITLGSVVGATGGPEGARGVGTRAEVGEARVGAAQRATRGARGDSLRTMEEHYRTAGFSAEEAHTAAIRERRERRRLRRFDAYDPRAFAAAEWERQSEERARFLPPGINSARDLETLMVRMDKMTREGLPFARHWYKDSGDEILARAGNTGRAEKYAALSAIFSPQTPVIPNIGKALRAVRQLTQTGDVQFGLDWQKRASKLAWEGKEWRGVLQEGPKVKSFFGNLMERINPARARQLGYSGDETTNDGWIASAYGYGTGKALESGEVLNTGNVNLSQQQYDFITRATQTLARHYHVDPMDAQAGLWVPAKASADKQFAARYAAGGAERRQAMRESAVSFAQGFSLPEHTVRIAYEALETMGHKPWTKGLTPRQLRRYTDRSGENIASQVQEQLGLPARVTDRGWGYWIDESGELQINPAGAIEIAIGTRRVPEGEREFGGARKGAGVAKGPAKLRLPQDERDFILGITASSGHFLRQEGVGFLRPIRSLADSNTTAWHVNLGRKITPDEIRAVHAGLGDDLYLSPSGDGFLVARTDPAAQLELEGRAKRSEYLRVMGQAHRAVDRGLGEGAWNELVSADKVEALSAHGGLDAPSEIPEATSRQLAQSPEWRRYVRGLARAQRDLDREYRGIAERQTGKKFAGGGVAGEALARFQGGGAADRFHHRGDTSPLARPVSRARERGLELIRQYEEHPSAPAKHFGPRFDWHDLGKVLTTVTGIDPGVVRERLRGNLTATLGPGGRPIAQGEVVGGTALPGRAGLARELDEWVKGGAHIERAIAETASRPRLRILPPGVRTLRPDDLTREAGEHVVSHASRNRAPGLYWPDRDALVMGREGWIHSEVAQALGFHYKVPPHMTFNGINDDWILNILKATDQVEYWKQGGFHFAGQFEPLDERWVIPPRAPSDRMVELLQEAHNAPIHVGMLAGPNKIIPKRKFATGGVAGGDSASAQRAMQLVRAYEDLPTEGGRLGPPVPSLKTLGHAALAIVGIDPGVVSKRWQAAIHGNVGGTLTTLGPGGRPMRPGEVSGGVGPFGRLPRGLANVLGKEAEAYLGFWQVARPRLTRRERAVEDARKIAPSIVAQEQKMAPDVQARAETVSARAALKAVGRNFPELAGKLGPMDLIRATARFHEDFPLPPRPNPPRPRISRDELARDPFRHRLQFDPNEVAGRSDVPFSKQAEYFVDEFLRLGRGQAPLEAPARREANVAAQVKQRFSGLQTAGEIAAQAEMAGMRRLSLLQPGQIFKKKLGLDRTEGLYRVIAQMPDSHQTQVIRTDTGIKSAMNIPNAQQVEFLPGGLRQNLPAGAAGEFYQRLIAQELQPVKRTPSQLQDLLSRKFSKGGMVDTFKEVMRPTGFQAGGIVPGPGITDTVPAMLTPGEAVISRPGVRSIESGADIAARQRDRMLAEEKRQTSMLSRIESNQRRGDPEVARLNAKLNRKHSGARRDALGRKGADELSIAGVKV